MIFCRHTNRAFCAADRTGKKLPDLKPWRTPQVDSQPTILFSIPHRNKIKRGIVIFSRLIACFIDRHPCASPAPLGGGGTCDSFFITGIPDPLLYNAILTGAKLRERLHVSGPFTRNTFPIWILGHYADYLFSRHFLYGLVVTMALCPEKKNEWKK